MKNYKYIINNDEKSLANFNSSKQRFNNKFRVKNNNSIPKLLSSSSHKKISDSALKDDNFKYLSNRKIRRFEKRRNKFDAITPTKKLNSKRLTVRSISAAKFAQDETANFLSKGADDNAGVEAAQKGVNTTSKATSKLKHFVERHPSKITKRRIEKQIEKKRLKHELKYDRKIHFQRSKLEYKNLVKETKLNDNNYIELNPIKKFFKRREMKKMIYAKNHTRIRDRIKNFIVDVGKNSLEFLKNTVKKLLTAIGILFLFILVLFNSCSSIGLSNNNINILTISTSYLASEETLINVEEYFSAKELDLENDINRISEKYPGYDEYILEQNEPIGHDPHMLLSYMTSILGEMKNSDFASELEKLFSKIYELKIREEIEIRYRSEEIYSLDEHGEVIKKEMLVPYEYKKLITTLIKKDMDLLIRTELSLYNDADVRLSHYDTLLDSKGNMPNLFSNNLIGFNLIPENVNEIYDYDITEGKFPPPNPSLILPGNTGAVGQCTWYVYNRIYQLSGKKIYSLGNGGDWGFRAQKQGFPVTRTAKVGTAISFPPGIAGASKAYGHIAFVEKVNSDGSIVVSEMNVKGKGVISTRTISASDASKSYFIDFGV